MRRVYVGTNMKQLDVVALTGDAISSLLKQIKRNIAKTLQRKIDSDVLCNRKFIHFSYFLIEKQLFLYICNELP